MTRWGRQVQSTHSPKICLPGELTSWKGLENLSPAGDLQLMWQRVNQALTVWNGWELRGCLLEGWVRVEGSHGRAVTRSRVHRGWTKRGRKIMKLKKGRGDVRSIPRPTPCTQRASHAGACLMHTEPRKWVVCLSAQPQSHTPFPLDLCTEVSLRTHLSLTLSLHSRHLSGARQSVGATWHYLLTGRSWLPGWSLPGRAWNCCILCVCRPLALSGSFWNMPRGRRGSWGLRLELRPSHSCRLPKLSPNARQMVKARSGTLTAAAVRLGQNCLARR